MLKKFQFNRNLSLGGKISRANVLFLQVRKDQCGKNADNVSRLLDYGGWNDHCVTLRYNVFLLVNIGSSSTVDTPVNYSVSGFSSQRQVIRSLLANAES